MVQCKILILKDYFDQKVSVRTERNIGAVTQLDDIQRNFFDDAVNY